MMQMRKHKNKQGSIRRSQRKRKKKKKVLQDIKTYYTSNLLQPVKPK